MATREEKKSRRRNAQLAKMDKKVGLPCYTGTIAGAEGKKAHTHNLPVQGAEEADFFWRAVNQARCV